MARPLRIEYPGAYFHVMNRGGATVEWIYFYPTKTEYLKNYPWSTLAGYCYLRKRDKNFDYGWLLNTYFGEDTVKGRRQCREYVYHAIEGEIETPFEEVVHQTISSNPGTNR